MSENRVDPTVAGLFLVAFITLVFGFLGVELYLGGNKLGNLLVPAMVLSGMIGALFIVLTVSAIRCGNSFATSLFAFVALALIAVPICFFSGSWFAFILLAIFFIVFALIGFLVGAPKLLAIMLFLVALLFLFVGLAGKTGTDAMSLMFGIFGLLSGLVALYLSFALSTEKLPVF